MSIARSWAIVAALAAGALAGCGRGQSGGVIIGDPTGLSFLQERSRKDAIAVAVGIESFDESGVFRGHVDWQRFLGLPRRGECVPYLGLGADVVVRDGPPGGEADADVAVRVPLGIMWKFSGGGGNFFAELALKLWADAADADFDAAIGIRIAP